MQTRRDKVRALAFKGKSRNEISETLGISYQTASTDLKALGIIPASPYKTKEN